MKKYLNFYEKQEWLKLIFISEVVEKLKDNPKYSTDTLKYLRSAYTYLEKATKEFAADYSEYARTLNNEIEYYNLIFLPKKEAIKKRDELIKEQKEDPADALYDVLDACIEMNCKGCEGKEGCRLKDNLEYYQIPELDINDKICKWRY